MSHILKDERHLKPWKNKKEAEKSASYFFKRTSIFYESGILIAG